MKTEEILVKSYGALITLPQLATVLSRSTEGLRLSLRRESAWTLRINAARVKVGRRIYFRTADIANLFDGHLGSADPN